MKHQELKSRRWGSWAAVAVPTAILGLSAAGKILQPPGAQEAFARFGYPPSVLPGLGLVEAACTILYLIPRTSMLGAVLLTGYLGGAISAHVRIHDSFLVPLALGIAVWAALWVREPRVRQLLPLWGGDSWNR